MLGGVNMKLQDLQLGMERIGYPRATSESQKVIRTGSSAGTSAGSSPQTSPSRARGTHYGPARDEVHDGQTRGPTSTHDP